MLKHKVLVFFSLILSLVASIYFSLFFFEKVWIIFLITGLLSFFYVWKTPGLNGKNLRDIPGIKIYLIGIVWVVITVLIPYLTNANLGLTNTIILFVSELLFMISITIPFDIRDINLDEASKKTIPQLIGIQNSIFTSIIIMIISQIMLQYLMPSLNIGIWLFTVISIVILYFSKPKRQELYFSGLTDGLLILQPILLYLFNF